MFLLKSHQQLDFWYQEIVAVSSVLLLAGPSFFGACTSRSPGVFLFLFIHSVITTVPLFWPSVSWLVYGRCCCLSKYLTLMLLLLSWWSQHLPGDCGVLRICAHVSGCVYVNAGPPIYLFIFSPQLKDDTLFFLTSLVSFPQGQTIQSEDKPISRLLPLGARKIQSDKGSSQIRINTDVDKRTTQTHQHWKGKKDNHTPRNSSTVNS